MRRLIVIEYEYVKVSSVCIKWFSKLRSKLSFNFQTSTLHATNKWGCETKCIFFVIRETDKANPIATVGYFALVVRKTVSVSVHCIGC